MDCCICISFAMSSGLVRMLLFQLVMQSSGGVSRFLKTFLFIFFGLISYSCLYFEMAFNAFFCVFGGDFSCLCIYCFC